jgi:nucleoside-diphosphate-sugar epimerase
METVLITGANGEVGHGLIPKLAKSKDTTVIALDLNEIDDELKPFVHESVVADILDATILENIISEHPISTVFHLAAMLSTSAEKNPERAHNVNVNGTSSLLSAVNRAASKEKRVIKFLFPSTVAIYGMPDMETKKNAKPIKEEEFNSPITMYGINKLYCEALGIYYSKYYQLLSQNERFVDFRSVRYPGIISALTMPSGGTSDYAPEMTHSAARGEGYESFVRADSIIPFMVMPDAIKSIMMLAQAPKEKLTRNVYNVSAFSVSADEISRLVNGAFPDSSISYKPDVNRQKIVDSWPSEIDDSQARKDWGWQPDYDTKKAFTEYLIPEIQNK